MKNLLRKIFFKYFLEKLKSEGYSLLYRSDAISYYNWHRDNNYIFKRAYPKRDSLIIKSKDYIEEAFIFFDNLTKENVINLEDKEIKKLCSAFIDFKIVFLIIENRLKQEDYAEFRNKERVYTLTREKVFDRIKEFYLSIKNKHD